MLTESEVQRAFTKLMKGAGADPAAFDKAEELLENLRPESPLRLRLGGELEELRRLAEAKS